MTDTQTSEQCGPQLAQDDTPAAAPPAEAPTDASDAEASAETAGPETSAEAAAADGGTLAHSLEELRGEVGRVRATCEAVLERLARLEGASEATAKQVSFLPPQVRQLGSKVEGLTTSVSEPRYRNALLGLLGIYDLVDQVLRTLPPAGGDEREAEHRRNYEVVLTQLRQLLDANGLSQIATDGVFDPTAHRVAQRVAVNDLARANLILEVVRPGFRTAQSVLRYAEVTVGHYSPPDDTESETGEENTSTPP